MADESQTATAAPSPKKKKTKTDPENSSGAHPTTIEERDGLPFLVLPPLHTDYGKALDASKESGRLVRLATITNRCFLCSVWILRNPLVSQKAVETEIEYPLRKIAVMACSRLVEGITNVTKIPGVRAEIVWRSRDGLRAFCDAEPKWERVSFFRVAVLRKLTSIPEEATRDTEIAMSNDVREGCTRIAGFMYDVARTGIDGRKIAIVSGHHMDVAFVLMTADDIMAAIASEKFPSLSALDFALPELRQELESPGKDEGKKTPAAYYSVLLFSIEAVFVGPKFAVEEPKNAK